MKGFRSVGAVQRFLSVFSGISSHFRPRRHLTTTPGHRSDMTVRFAIWDQVTGVAGRPAGAWAPARNPAPPHAPMRRQRPPHPIT
ncbi:hypothetical protein SUDANB176_00153 [Streptomyces sp. enrichment culture]